MTFFLPFLLLAPVAAAELSMPVVFGDGMVIQRDAPIRIFGSASEHATVTVELAGQGRQATVRDGRWQLTLPAMPAGGPHQLRVSDGTTTKIFKDVMIGEVWLASGQSNMAMAVQHTTDFEQHLPKSENAQLRFLKIPVTEFGEINRKQTKWARCTPDSAKKFSAVAYHFAVDLQKRLGVTVGVIGSYRGGTWNENWMTPDSIKNEAKLKYLFDKYDTEYGKYENEAAYEKAYQEYLVKLDAWRKKGGWSHGMVPFAPLGPKAYQRPSGLYECMIKPLQPYAIKGVIWYQGEGNSARHQEFRTLFPAFVKGWRETWQNPELPFYFVQLPGFKDPSWPHFRQAQLDCATAIPNCGLVVSEGCGDVKDIHPKTKKPIGDRLATAISAEVYGHKHVPFGPIVKSLERRGNKLIVHFDHVGAGLVAKGDALASFEIAGADKAFVKAKAEIVGPIIEVSARGIPKPTHARYAFAPDPLMDLFNKDGLPASPFTAALPKVQRP